MKTEFFDGQDADAAADKDEKQIEENKAGNQAAENCTAGNRAEHRREKNPLFQRYHRLSGSGRRA